MEEPVKKKIETYKYHRFLDEAGDTTFYGKGKTPIIGSNGVSKSFILGMLKINQPLTAVREKIITLQNQITNDPYFAEIPSIQKKKELNAYYLHATDDIPEVRKMAFELINSIDCSFEAVVGRKIYALYEKKHNGNEAEFYADLLSHLLKNKMNKYDELVLNISHRSKCTTHQNLEKGLQKAIETSARNNPDKCNCCKVVFNVQQPTREPLLNISDYFCWAVQRVFEKGETRYYDFISDKVSTVIDLYDSAKWSNYQNYYGRKRKLTKENLIQ